MNRIIFIAVFYVFLMSFLFPLEAKATVNPAQYDSLPLPINEKKVTALANDSLMKMMEQSYFIKQKVDQFGQAATKPFVNRTWDFYFLLSLVLFLGIIRLFDSTYIQELWLSFFNAGQGNKYRREKLERAFYTNLLMNIFFTISLATYFYYIFQNFSSLQFFNKPQVIYLLLLICGISLIYITKYLVIRFSGWALNMQNVTDNYLFNVFLVNKILAIALLPFTIFLAFPNPFWASYLLLASVILIASSFIVRYIQSWKVSSASFKLSKFHFFTYLCASEILPLAVLIKLVWTKISI